MHPAIPSKAKSPVNFREAISCMDLNSPKWIVTKRRLKGVVHHEWLSKLFCKVHCEGFFNSSKLACFFMVLKGLKWFVNVGNAFVAA